MLVVATGIYKTAIQMLKFMPDKLMTQLLLFRIEIFFLRHFGCRFECLVWRMWINARPFFCVFQSKKKKKKEEAMQQQREENNSVNIANFNEFHELFTQWKF